MRACGGRAGECALACSCAQHAPTQACVHVLAGTMRPSGCACATHTLHTCARADRCTQLLSRGAAVPLQRGVCHGRGRGGRVGAEGGVAALEPREGMGACEHRGREGGGLGLVPRQPAPNCTRARTCTPAARAAAHAVPAVVAGAAPALPAPLVADAARAAVALAPAAPTRRVVICKVGKDNQHKRGREQGLGPRMPGFGRPHHIDTNTQGLPHPLSSEWCPR